MARTDSPFRQQPAPKSKAKAKSKAEERKPDYISQYLAILAHYHKKSSESSSDESNQFVEIETDFKRAYFPGQTVAARVGVPKAALLDNGDGFEEVIVEFKGEIHAFGKAYDGQGSYSFQTDTLFNHKLTLHSNSNSNQDDQSNEKISAKEITSNSSSQASNETSTDLKEWQIKSFLPKEIDLQTEQGLKTLELPTSFKDKFSDPTNFVVYCWKVTGVKKGKFKKSVRKWLPILMPSFAGGPPPDLSVGLQNSNILSNSSPPSYENESSTTSPSSTPQDLNLPSNWITKKISHKVKKAGLFEREIIDITFMMPEPKFVTNSPLPFVFKIDVSCKDKKEFGEGGNVRLPKLPFEDGRIYGEDEEEEWIPSFDLRRVDDSQAITEAAGFNANDQSASLLSCQISWNQSHLSKEKQEQLQRNGGSSETVNQVSANNSTDASAEPSITSSQSTVDVQNQDGNGTRNVDPFEKFNIGQDWSEPLLVQPVQNQDQTNGGGSKLFKSKGPQSRWVRTAIVSGKISANVVPILQTPNLRTQYILSLYYGIPSLVTTIQEDLCSWIPSSGISNSMLSVLNNADVIRRIAGPNLGLLMNAARDGQSGREVGRNRQPEMGGMNDSTSEFGYGDSRDTFGTFTRSEGDEDEKVAH